jgi:hypothetical protein
MSQTIQVGHPQAKSPLYMVRQGRIFERRCTEALAESAQMAGHPICLAFHSARAVSAFPLSAFRFLSFNGRDEPQIYARSDSPLDSNDAAGQGRTVRRDRCQGK